jgi:ribosomal protein S18 acetylase RimI-like enzyme
MSLVHLAAHHRDALVSILGRTKEFSEDDREVALELLDLGIRREDTYRFWVWEGPDGKALGYICFGPTPMTQGTFDLYWICVDPDTKGQGLGRKLVAGMEETLKSEGARLIRVETAGTEEYAATRAFYDRLKYEVVAQIRDFYWPGNDLFIYGRYL